MRTVIFTLALGVILSSCSTSNKEAATTSDSSKVEQAKEKKPEHKTIYVTTFTYVGKNGKNEMTKDVVPLTSDYFDIELKIMGDGKTYQTDKEIEPITDPDNFKSVSIGITDEKSTMIDFKSSTDFLNYMSAGGYDMVSQEKSKYKTSYTFKKK